MKVKQIRHSLVSKVIRKTAVTVKPNENKAPGTARQVETKVGGTPGINTG